MDVNAIAKMYTHTRYNGGGTFDLKGKVVKSKTGYAVATTNRTTTGWPSFKRAVLALAIAERASLIGTWEDGADLDAQRAWRRHRRFIYVDKVTIIDGKDNAFAIARKYAQVAIYDFAEKAVVNVPPAEVGETSANVTDTVTA